MKYISRMSALLIVIGAVSFASDQTKQPQPMQFRALIAEQDRQLNAELQKAAAASHLKLAPDTVTVLNVNRARIFIAAIENGPVSAGSFSEGMDVAFGYFDPPQSPMDAKPPLPAGFYRIRITSPPKTQQSPPAGLRSTTEVPPGANAQAEFLDASGKVVAKIDAAIGNWGGREPQNKNTNAVVSTLGPQIGGERIMGFCRFGAMGWTCWGSDFLNMYDLLKF